MTRKKNSKATRSDSSNPSLAERTGADAQGTAPKAGELLASRIRDRIIRGDLKEGDRLPPERALMEEFGVSRATFREACRVLEAEGLLSVSRGARNGAMVRRASVGNV